MADAFIEFRGIVRPYRSMGFFLALAASSAAHALSHADPAGSGILAGAVSRCLGRRPADRLAAYAAQLHHPGGDEGQAGDDLSQSGEHWASRLYEHDPHRYARATNWRC